LLTIRVGLILEQRPDGAFSEASFEQEAPGADYGRFSGVAPQEAAPAPEHQLAPSRSAPHPRHGHAPHAPHVHHATAAAPHRAPHAAPPVHRHRAVPGKAARAAKKTAEPDKFASRKHLLGGPKPDDKFETRKKLLGGPKLPAPPPEALKPQEHAARKRLLGGAHLSAEAPAMLRRHDEKGPKHFAGAGTDWRAHMDKRGFASHTDVMRAQIRQGFTPEDAAAITGNWMHESGGQQYRGKPVILNPATEGYGPRGVNKSGNAAWGAAQWEGRRKRGLTDPSLESQVRHAWEEMHSYERRAYEAMRHAKGVAAKAIAVSHLYERPKVPRLSDRGRVRNALEAYRDWAREEADRQAKIVQREKEEKIKQARAKLMRRAGL
jgi:hypothetical protein